MTDFKNEYKVQRFDQVLFKVVNIPNKEKMPKAQTTNA